MREINVTIEGLSPLLMHSTGGMRKSNAGRNTIPTPEEEAATACYWTDDHKSLAVPSTAVHGCLVRASGRFKVGKRTASSVIAPMVHIAPEMIPLGTKEYIIDVRSAVVQKQRIFRARPKITPWKLNFSLYFNEEWLPVEFMRGTMVDIINTAGAVVGLLDFRPEKKGPFGTFRLARYELLKRAAQEQVAPPQIVGF